ncbi:hypothetical protein GmHk_12G034112 [Glycine max]|nr:hypothetical protein GmHk_12G034112 [Glycine max]
MVKLMCEIYNHELSKSLVGHSYVGRLSKVEKTFIVDMTKSMVKPRNILLTLKEHNVNSCTTIKQIYNARSAYRSSIRGSDTEMQHLMKLLERDQQFYKTNRYKLPVLDFVGMTPTEMTFSVDFAYLEGEHLNNVVWALECFRGLFLRRDVLPGVIVTDKDQTLMNGTLLDCPSEQQFDECLKKFEMVCSPWPIFVDYVKDTWIIPHKKKFVTAWTNKRGMVEALSIYKKCKGYSLDYVGPRKLAHGKHHMRSP